MPRRLGDAHLGGHAGLERAVGVLDLAARGQPPRLGIERGTDPGDALDPQTRRDRNSTRLNSSHMSISYAVFCLKKKKKTTEQTLLPIQTYDITNYARQSSNVIHHSQD